MTHNVPPNDLGALNIECDEMLFYTYMPVKLANSSLLRVPPRLRCFESMIDRARTDFEFDFDGDYDHHIYLTAKSLYVTPDCIGGREGWHIDGFGTDDRNYIWSDRLETEFCIQDFDLSDDCDLSLKQMEQQAKPESIRTFGEGRLLGLDNRQVHRCPSAPIVMRRTFAKVSFSKDRYDLKGNSHNHLLDYHWHMFDRNEDRNHPTFVATSPSSIGDGT